MLKAKVNGERRGILLEELPDCESVAVSGGWKDFIHTIREQRLDFMAALLVSAASSEKGSGVPEGVALPRVARDEASLAASAGSPPERRHQ